MFSKLYHRFGRLQKQTLFVIFTTMAGFCGIVSGRSTDDEATAEVFMVYYIDDLDAKMSQVTAAIDSEQSDSNWTAWKSALRTRLYKKRIE